MSLVLTSVCRGLSRVDTIEANLLFYKIELIRLISFFLDSSFSDIRNLC